MVEPEAPVRPPAFPSSRLRSPSRKRQRRAVVDRRLAARELHLALEIELLRRLIGGIDPAGFAQPLERRLVAVEPGRLAMLLVAGEAEPGEILAYPFGMGLARALLVGVVEAEDEAAAMLPRPQPIVDGGADVADMEPPGRRGGAKRVTTLMRIRTCRWPGRSPTISKCR
jgi:hypothetical protein